MSELPESAANDKSVLDDIARAYSSRVVLEIDTRRVIQNLEVARSLWPGRKVMPVLKGDAYGVGALPLARELERHGVDGFAVDNVAEGIALRSGGIQSPVLVLDGCVPENAHIAVAYGLMPGIATEPLLRAYNGAAQRAQRQLPVWLYFNCGFNRSGHRSPDEFRAFVEAARNCKWLLATTVYSHLSTSHSDAAHTARQIQEYENALHVAQDALGAAVSSSLLASHGILCAEEPVSTDWIRPGFVLYGCECVQQQVITPRVSECIARLVPALTVKARLLHVRQFSREEFCGYGLSCKMKSGQSLATVAVGFGNGLPSAVGSASFTFGRHRFPVLVVGMDYSQIDITERPDLQPGDWVTLFGDPREGHHSLKEFAAGLGVSPYVLMRQLQMQKNYHFSGASHAV